LRARALNAVQAQLGSPETFVVESRENGAIVLRPTERLSKRLSQRALRRTMDVLSRRLNANGRAILHIERAGERRILVAGLLVDGPEDLRRLVAPGEVTIHLVLSASPDVVAAPAQSRVILAQPYPGSGFRTAIPVQRRAGLIGGDIARAETQPDAGGRMRLIFELNAEGQQRLCTLSRRNAGAQFALLLDEAVVAAPRIKGEMCGGRAQFDGLSPETASTVRALLSAGPLPAPLRVVSQGSGAPNLSRQTKT
jgi:preprotein translocase subunit SecD